MEDRYEGSPFLAIPPHEHVAGNRAAFAIFDRFPVTEGHALVVPRRLIGTWWEATDEERADMLALVDEVRAVLDERHQPDGYNLGVNVGEAAGQTVPHLHLHVIPRYEGDVPDPRGGVRHVIPELANYLQPGLGTRPASAPAPSMSVLLDGVQRHLELELVRAIINDRYDRIDLIVSFIMRSGVEIIDPRLDEAIENGARVRVLTTDYLGVTDPDALTRLLDLREIHGERVEIRVFTDPAISFHPKAYLFYASDGSIARGFVGSSNLSRSGIAGGVEWNLMVDDIAALRRSFDAIWVDPRSIVLDHEWLATYRRMRRPATPSGLPEIPTIGVEIEPVRQPVEPRPIQQEALRALEDTRDAGHIAGLVVMATGLGKTWVAAFDTTRPGFRRVLFVAHRDEILRQSLDAFRQVRPSAELGLFTGSDRQPHADVVFASVQTLTNRLHEFDPDDFDYVVVDEFHHAAARTYRRVIDHFDPRFLLGLTATPERLDGADLLSLCGDNLVFECDLVDGIRRDELAPFRYVGIADPVDFDPIPWRNGRFDAAALTAAVETNERAQRAFDEWQERGGRRTLAFCVTTTHADFMADFFRERGVACASVHSGRTSASRTRSVEELAAGDIEVLFAVDIFNEGFDLPSIDTVLMLRPTESPVVFLQQLGRGLRLSEDKDHLQVIDFIGNHRSFLQKPRTLFALGGRDHPSRAALREAVHDTALFDLPDGCSVSWELGAIEVFDRLLAMRGREANALVEYIRDQVDETGIRPTAVQAFRAGLNVGSASRAGGWFGLLHELGVLEDDQRRVVVDIGDVLAQLEKEPLTRAYKLVTLRAMLHDEALRTGMRVGRLADLSRQIVSGDPRLAADARSSSMDPETASTTDWLDFWQRNPIAALTATGKRTGPPLFQVVDDRFEPTFTATADDGPPFDAMVEELVEYRLARYLSRPGAEGDSIVLKVSHADGRPILFLDRDRHPETPSGWTQVIADGRRYELNFVKVAVNVARAEGEDGNALHGLLRGWFGEKAGLPGTDHRVVLRDDGVRLTMTPARRATPSVVPPEATPPQP